MGKSKNQKDRETHEQVSPRNSKDFRFYHLVEKHVFKHGKQRDYKNCTEKQVKGYLNYQLPFSWNSKENDIELYVRVESSGVWRTEKYRPYKAVLGNLE
jgi:hypothetical protein